VERGTKICGNLSENIGIPWEVLYYTVISFSISDRFNGPQCILEALGCTARPTITADHGDADRLLRASVSPSIITGSFKKLAFLTGVK
jgi:hypothetical protein